VVDAGLEGDDALIVVGVDRDRRVRERLDGDRGVARPDLADDASPDAAFAGVVRRLVR